jgi:hypothetical protein
MIETVKYLQCPQLCESVQHGHIKLACQRRLSQAPAINHDLNTRLSAIIIHKVDS